MIRRLAPPRIKPQVAFAHSTNALGVRHDLVEHVRAVAETARIFAIGLSAAELAYYAGLWHDLGKFHPDFQVYLLRSEADPSVRRHGPDHKAAGSTLARIHCQPLCLLIQGHHGGLRNQRDFAGWLHEKEAGSAVTDALALAHQAMSDLMPGHPVLPPAFAKSDPFAAEMFLRLLFSALVDADFLDTERHFRGDQAAARGSDVGVEELWNRFEADQSALIARGDGAVNKMRRDVYQYAVAAAEEPLGFFRLTVPTGGGMSRSAMAFALRHALKYGLERVVVAVPFISITEQTASVYRDLFRDAGEHIVLEHHSMAGGAEDADGDFHADAVWDRLAAENWDSPVIVTTTVQLFDSLFGNQTGRTRKLHRLARSVIILDEAQALPSHLLKPILDGLRQLVANYGATVVLSTATQPAFNVIPEFDSVRATEIVPNPAGFFDILRRVDYEWRTDAALSWSEVAALMRAEPRALAVLNTKKDALALLDAVDDPDARHLSTLLCGAHRRDVIVEAKRRLEADEPCRLVSTQVVEAGVDLDFPLVLRALAPLDSVIQAAGRCNREGRLERGRVVVFEPEDGGLPRGAYTIGAGVTRSLQTAARLDGRSLDPHDLPTLRTYFQRFLGTLGERGLDRDEIQPLRRTLSYADVASAFKMVDDDTYAVLITNYGRADEQAQVNRWVDALRAGSPAARELRRRLQPYVVAVRWREAQRLLARGLINEVRPGYGIWLGGYDPIRGFTGADADVLIA